MAVNSAEKLSSSLEDYLEAIYNLSAESKVARSKDIAEALGVAKSSVTGALRSLSERDLVNYKPYGYVTLTEIGHIEAARVARKHDIIKSFFVDVLGVDTSEAGKAACQAEHAMGPKIVTRLLSFMEFVNESGENGFDLIEEFREFCRKDNRSDNDSQVSHK